MSLPVSQYPGVVRRPRSEARIPRGSDAHKTLFCRTLLVLLWERLSIARNVGHGVQDNNFTVSGTGSVANELRPSQLIELCLAENQRRMSAYDARLLRPAVVPTLARWVRRLLA
jgi:hypothetical protein